VRRKRLLKLGILGAAAIALPLVVGAAPAFADYQPQPGDIVGVGGDTPQYAIDFALNGYPHGGLGFNSSATVNRVVEFDATADGNGRSGYLQGSTEASPKALNPTDVLRANSYPTQRVSSSGTAIKALLADWEVTPDTAHKQDPTYQNQINFIFSASKPSAANQTQAVNQGWGGLHTVQVATDNIEVAVNSGTGGTNAPTGLSAQQLLYIYSTNGATWNNVPGTSGLSTDVIIPELPPAGSSVYKTFIKALNKVYNNTTGTTPAFTLSTSVVTVEQNDPTAVTGAATPADALVPFAAGRLTLWNNGFFHNPNVLTGGAALTPNVSLLTGTPSDSNPVYKSAISDYIIFRQSDLSDPPNLEPGGTLNWAQALFSDTGGPAPFFDKSSTGALLRDAGVTWAYSDLGVT
jgi:hypothetical protein